MSKSSLFKSSALAACLAGVCLVGIDVLTLVFGNTTVGSGILVLLTILCLFAFTGIYLWQREQSAAFGVVSYILVFFGLASLVGVNFALAFVFPHLEESAVQELMRGTTGVASSVAVFAFLAGIVLFGISLIIAHVFFWPAALLLSIGFVPMTLSAFIPAVFVHIGGFMAGTGIFWLGVLLWSFAKKEAD